MFDITKSSLIDGLNAFVSTQNDEETKEKVGRILHDAFFSNEKGHNVVHAPAMAILGWIHNEYTKAGADKDKPFALDSDELKKTIEITFGAFAYALAQVISQELEAEKAATTEAKQEANAKQAKYLLALVRDMYAANKDEAKVLDEVMSRIDVLKPLSPLTS